MITLTTVSYPQEAEMLCMKLRANGIETFIPDQNTTYSQPLFSGAIGGIRIQIDENDLPLATEILGAEMSQAEKERSECPSCKSRDVAYERISKWFLFLCMLCIGIPFMWFKGKRKCNSCGCKWEEK